MARGVTSADSWRHTLTVDSNAGDSACVAHSLKSSPDEFLLKLLQYYNTILQCNIIILCTSSYTKLLKIIRSDIKKDKAQHSSKDRQRWPQVPQTFPLKFKIPAVFQPNFNQLSIGTSTGTILSSEFCSQTNLFIKGGVCQLRFLCISLGDCCLLSVHLPWSRPESFRVQRRQGGTSWWCVSGNTRCPTSHAR